MYLQSKTNRGKIDTSYLVCIFFFCLLLLCYLNTKLCHPLLIFIFRMELCLQRCHCMTTDLCSSFETDMLRPLPLRPGPAQAHKCLKNTRLSAGASVKTVLSTHLTKPGSRKEKSREKSPILCPATAWRHTADTKKRLQKWLMGQGAPFSGFLTCSCPV